MMRIIRLLIFYLSMLLLSLFTVGLITFHVFQRDFSNVVLQSIQPYLKADVKVKKIEANLFENFPKGSIELVQVRIKETYEGSPENAYDIGRVYLLFDYADLFSGKFRIRHIVLRDAEINMIVNSNGETNFEFWRFSDEVDDSTEVALDIDKVEVYNSRYNFLDFSENFMLRSTIKEGSFSLHTIGDDTHMDIKADFELNELKDGELQWIKDKNLKSHLGFSILDLDQYTIKDGDLQIEGMNFLINGQIDNSTPAIITDLSIKSEYSRLEELIMLSPGLLQGSLDDYSIEGAAWFNTTIKGAWTDSSNARIDVGFGFKDGSITQKSTGLTLSELGMVGHYSNGSRKDNSSSYITLKEVKGRHNTGEIMGDFALANFDNPFLNFNLNGNLDLAWVHEMFRIPGINSINGRVECDISFKGELSDLEQQESLSEIAVSGEASLAEVNVNWDDLPTLFDVNAELSFERPYLMVNNLKGAIGRTNFLINGYFKNPLTFFKEEKLVLYGDAECDSLFVMDFFREDSLATSDSSGFSFPNLLFVKLNIKLDYLEYEKFKATDIQGGFRYYKRKLEIEPTQFQTLGGNLKASGLAKANLFNGYTVDLDIDFDDLDVSETFLVFDNFDQEFITSSHLKGRISADGNLAFQLNDAFDLRSKSLVSELDVIIINGELIEFLPMVKLAGFIKVGNFNHMIFDTLENSIFIKDEFIHIPKTSIHSNTVDMELAGTHSFENVVDYDMELNLKKLFMKENRITDRTFKFYASEPNGGMRVFLKVIGPGDDPKITYNTNALGGKVLEDMKDEVEELRKARERERRLIQSRQDSLSKVHRKMRRQRRRESLWEGL